MQSTSLAALSNLFYKLTFKQINECYIGVQHKAWSNYWWKWGSRGMPHCFTCRPMSPTTLFAGSKLPQCTLLKMDMKICHYNLLPEMCQSHCCVRATTVLFIRDHSEFGYILMKQQAFIHYLTWTYLTLCASSLPWAVILVDLFENCIYDYFEEGVKKPLKIV